VAGAGEAVPTWPLCIPGKGDSLLLVTGPRWAGLSQPLASRPREEGGVEDGAGLTVSIRISAPPSGATSLGPAGPAGGASSAPLLCALGGSESNVAEGNGPSSFLPPPPPKLIGCGGAAAAAGVGPALRRRRRAMSK
jgi:hypothetical protein